MARQVIPLETLLGGFGAYSAGAAHFVWTAAIAADKEKALLNNSLLLLAYNSDGANPYTATVTSTADPFGRTGDITAYSLAAGDYAVFGPFKNIGWMQSDGYLYFEAENAAVKWAAFFIP